VIRRYDLLHKGAGVNGRDVARPAEFLIDSSGTIRWINLTGDLRVRARPDQIIQAAKSSKLATNAKCGVRRSCRSLQAADLGRVSSRHGIFRDVPSTNELT